jgi:hypothetical protein
MSQHRPPNFTSIEEDIRMLRHLVVQQSAYQRGLAG